MSDREFTRRVVKAVAIIAGAVVLLAALWEARGALMLIYVSALIAMGFSPLVRIIERPHRDRRFVPRWLAILAIYLSIVGVIALIANAEGNAARSTRVGINARRDGCATALKTPSSSVSANNSSIVMAPV